MAPRMGRPDKDGDRRVRCECGQLYKYNERLDSVLIDIYGHVEGVSKPGAYFMGFGPRSIFAPEEEHRPCWCGRPLWFVNQPQLFEVEAVNAS